MIQTQNYWLLTVLFFGLLATGCGRNVPLQGKVMYEDGTPITVGMVHFASETVLARGAIRPDGTFVVGTLHQADGLPPGEYKVYILGAEEMVPGSMRDLGVDSMGVPIQSMPAFQQLVDRKYMSADQTPLTCTVPAPGNRFDIIVERPAHLQR